MTNRPTDQPPIDQPEPNRPTSTTSEIRMNDEDQRRFTKLIEEVIDGRRASYRYYVLLLLCPSPATTPVGNTNGWCSLLLYCRLKKTFLFFLETNQMHGTFKMIPPLFLFHVVYTPLLLFSSLLFVYNTLSRRFSSHRVKETRAHAHTHQARARTHAPTHHVVACCCCFPLVVYRGVE